MLSEVKKMPGIVDVLEATRGLLVAAQGPQNASFARALIDSRQAAAGDLFFALRGDRHDAHDFLAAAFAAGAAGAVVARPVEAPAGTAVFHVSDPLAALQRLAAYWREKHDLRVIGVTGSVGKTTAKELIATVLSSRYRVLKSEANLNTEIGIPLTLLQLRPEHQCAVLELAMYVPGDIALLAEISRPQVAVVMNVGPVHLERAGSIGRIAAAKAELVEALPADGLAVLNGDDARVSAMSRRTRARTVRFGLSEQCDVRAKSVVGHGLDGISFRLCAADGPIDVRCPLPGKHHVYAALAAAAVALNAGMSLGEIARALAEARPDLRLTPRRGVNGCTIIDDSYNASPASMIAALDLLSELPGRRVALLGDMRELGSAEDEGHRRAGRRAASACDLLFVTGERAHPLYEAALKAGMTTARYVSAGEAIDALRHELRAGDYLLVKASRAVGLEAVVDALVGR